VEETTKSAYLEIFYEKNPQYRTIYTDGAIGGTTPSNGISLSFYATRNAIPKSVKHPILTDGSVSGSGEVSADSKSGIIREIEVGVYMNKHTARDLYEFLKKIFEQDGK
jgi:hypothetical protein